MLNILKNKSLMQILVWIFALALGILLGSLNINLLNHLFNFIALCFTRLFQCLAIPVIALAVITALSKLTEEKNTGRIFKHTIFYTLLTTFLAAITGLILYILFTPNNITVNNSVEHISSASTYYEYIVSIIPNNILQPVITGNALSVILIAAAVGIALSVAQKSENVQTLVRVILGIQEILFILIQGMIKILPIGIMAFAAQLSSQIINNSAIGALGQYTAVVLTGNIIQTFIILPLLLLVKRINPVLAFKNMFTAIVTAFFTKSSAGTLPVTLECAEKNLNINPKISRFVLPICTTINMNGCAAFILITSLFIMQNAGMQLTLGTMVMWVFISVFAAVGNAGVPMGCYFLTLSLMSSIGVPIGILGLILPVYSIIDMVETTENVWSDSVVCIVTNKDINVS